MAIVGAGGCHVFGGRLNLLGFAHLRSLRHFRSHRAITLTAKAILAGIGALWRLDRLCAVPPLHYPEVIDARPRRG